METFSSLLAICVGNSQVPDEFPAHRPMTRSFHVFFPLRLNKRLSKQSWGWWFETLSQPLWRHCKVTKKTSQVTQSKHLCCAITNTAQWQRVDQIKQLKLALPLGVYMSNDANLYSYICMPGHDGSFYQNRDNSLVGCSENGWITSLYHRPTPTPTQPTQPSRHPPTPHFPAPHIPKPHRISII